MEPEEYIEYFEDAILSRTPESNQKGCYARVSSWKRPTMNMLFKDVM